MDQISIHCPHCGTKDVGATVRAAYGGAAEAASIFATCNRCFSGVVAFAKLKRRIPEPHCRDLLHPSMNEGVLLEGAEIRSIAPALPPPREIGHLPANIGSAYREAEENLHDKRWLSAAGNYRTALERALKAMPSDDRETPGTRRLSIYERIEALAAANALPKAMIGLMHEVRFLGNEIHEKEDPSPEDVIAGGEFATLLLTYLFDLPARVDAAKRKRAGFD